MSEQPARMVSEKAREQVLADAFVRLADTLVEDYDVVDLLNQLTEACLDLLQVAAAGMLLDDQQGHLVVVATSSEEARLVEVFQLQNNEGPCLDCLSTQHVVESGHLETQDQRWPLFAPAAVAAGFRSVAAVPLRLRERTIGALNLFSSEPDEIPESDQRLAQALADIATIGILQQRLIHQGTVLGEQLQHALNSRVTVEQAKGVLAERKNLSMQAAFEELRAYARQHNRKLTDVASAVVNDGLTWN
ncbi:MAG: GAF and ANTAR domain-containing protein [Actinomycetales bacterium]|jgi:GAF domain-containing protein